jgi:hypothetical protein
MFQGPPFKENVPGGNVDLFKTARKNESLLSRHYQIREVHPFCPVHAGQCRLSPIQDIELVNIEFPYVVYHRGNAFMLVPLVKDQTSTLTAVTLPFSLHDKRKVGPAVDIVGDFEVENVAVVPLAGTRPDQYL